MLAYQEPETILELSKEVQQAGWEVQVYGRDQPTLAVLLRSPGAAILAFRGTRVSGFERLDTIFTQPWMNYADLKTDAQFVPMAFAKAGNVHGGILGSYERFWRAHGETMKRSIGERALLLTGHSLGAALATVAGATGHLESAKAVYSFGSPRVGDRGFRAVLESMNLAVHRFVHGHDLVTTLAPEGWLGFTHVSDILHLKNDGSGIDDDEPDLAKVLLNALRKVDASLHGTILNFQESRLMSPLKMLVPKGALADHAPLFYVERIRELAKRVSAGQE